MSVESVRLQRQRSTAWADGMKMSAEQLLTTRILWLLMRSITCKHTWHSRRYMAASNSGNQPVPVKVNWRTSSFRPCCSRLIGVKRICFNLYHLCHSRSQHFFEVVVFFDIRRLLLPSISILSERHPTTLMGSATLQLQCGEEQDEN